jgi:hypothetical protein
MTPNPGAADQLRATLATVAAIPVTPDVRPPSHRVADEGRGQIGQILAGWGLAAGGPR